MSNNSELDIEEKINSLVEAFSHSRDVILEVLKKNNYSIDQTALELSEIPVPEPPPQIRSTVPQQQQQQQPPPPYPGRQQQPPLQQPNQRNEIDEKNALMKDLASLIGNQPLDQSTIFNIYQASNKSIDRTIEHIKEMTVDPEKEQQEQEKRALEEFEQLKKKRLEIETKRMLEEQKRLQIEYERKRIQVENQKKEALVKKKMEEEELLKQQQILLIKQQQQQQQESLRQQELLKQEALKQEMVKQESLRQELLRQEMLRQEAAKQQLHQQEIIEQQKKEILYALEKQSVENQMIKQKELENLLLIEKQKKEILESQKQIDLFKQKEYESQLQNKELMDQHAREIELLKKKLQEEECKHSETAEKKTIEEIQKMEVENKLKNQIMDLEQQISELENVQRPRIVQLEEELKKKQLELHNIIISNQVLLTACVEENSSDCIGVNWNLENKYEENSTYWIGIFPTHQPKHDRYHSFKHITGKEGLVSFPSIIPGRYEARIFKDKYTLIHTSPSVQIGPTIELGAHVLGDQINITYKVIAKDGVSDGEVNANRDWIGIYNLGSRNKKYIESVYANSNGTSTFKSPRVPGIYEIRYFLYPTKYNEQAVLSFRIEDNDKVIITQSNQSPCNGNLVLSPDQEFKVDYIVNTVPPSSSDWVGIFSIGELSNKNYMNSKYTNGTGTGELTFRAPLKNGEYEARFFSYSKGKYITHKTSNKFIVNL